MLNPYEGLLIALTPSPSPSGRGEQERREEAEKARLPSPTGRRVRDEGVSKVARQMRQISPKLLQRAKELRQKQTPAEKILWECLRDRRLLNAKFRRQHNLGQFIADFYCHAAQLVIELDGEIHNTRIAEDANRDEWMQANGLTVLRFKNHAVFEQIDQVLEAIAEVLEPSPLASLPQGEGNKINGSAPFSLGEKGWG